MAIRVQFARTCLCKIEADCLLCGWLLRYRTTMNEAGLVVILRLFSTFVFFIFRKTQVDTENTDDLTASLSVYNLKCDHMT